MVCCWGSSWLIHCWVRTRVWLSTRPMKGRYILILFWPWSRICAWKGLIWRLSYPRQRLRLRSFRSISTGRQSLKFLEEGSRLIFTIHRIRRQIISKRRLWQFCKFTYRKMMEIFCVSWQVRMKFRKPWNKSTIEWKV